MMQPESQNNYNHPILSDLPPSYYSAVEERCEHLEELSYTTLELLREVIEEFQSPGLKPILAAIIERLSSVAAFMETELASLGGLDEAK